jgi:hypothetical protein
MDAGEKDNGNLLSTALMGVSVQYHRKPVFQIRNPKPEIRNKSKAANPNAQNRRLWGVSDIESLGI